MKFDGLFFGFVGVYALIGAYTVLWLSGWPRSVAQSRLRNRKHPLNNHRTVKKAPK